MLRAVRLSRALSVAFALSLTVLASPARAENPLVVLGQKLFFDTRLSGSGRTACATCHEPRFGYAQARRVATSDNGQLGKRNAPSILDVRYFPFMMWDGRFPSLEHQVFGPYSSGEMGNPIHVAVARIATDPEYVDMFGAAFDGPPTPDTMARAIAAYERTLVSRESRVDRFLLRNEPALSPLERHGFEVFTRRAQCDRCHHVFPANTSGSGPRRPLFTDFQFHNVGAGFGSQVLANHGVPDVGRHEQTRNPRDWGAFRTPSLRNSARTPPYMHDGGLATLEQVVDFYSAGGIPNPNLSPLIRPLNLHEQEKAALVAFLRAMGE